MLISKVRGSPLSEMMAGMQNLNWIRSNFQYLIKHSSIWLCSEWAHTDNIYRIFKRLLELNLFHTVLQEAKLNGGQLEEPSRSQNRIFAKLQLNSQLHLHSISTSSQFNSKSWVGVMPYNWFAPTHLTILLFWTTKPSKLTPSTQVKS